MKILNKVQRINQPFAKTRLNGSARKKERKKDCFIKINAAVGFFFLSKIILASAEAGRLFREVKPHRASKIIC